MESLIDDSMTFIDIFFLLSSPICLALDSHSEAIVQSALDELLVSSERTTIIIAHRLSTIRNASKIAFVGNGRVLEIG